MVITKTTINTGSTRFETLDELDSFLFDFNVVQKIRGIIQQGKSDQTITSVVTNLTTPFSFEQIIVSQEALNYGYAPEWSALMEILGWTSETFISYEYT